MAEINGNLVDAGGSCEEPTERNQIPEKKLRGRGATGFAPTGRARSGHAGKPQSKTKQSKTKAKASVASCDVLRLRGHGVWAGSRKAADKSHCICRGGQPQAAPATNRQALIGPANRSESSESQNTNLESLRPPKTRRLAVRCRVPVYAAHWACLQWDEHANRRAVFVIVRPFEAGGAFGRKANHLDVRNNRTC